MFWVIRNGIKMTGMPGFATSGVKDEEIWKIVAYVKKWESVTPEDYKAWTESTAATPPPVVVPAGSVMVLTRNASSSFSEVRNLFSATAS